MVNGHLSLRLNKLITIIDNDMGNIQSVSNALFNLGIKSRVSDNSKKIKDSSGIILPGVGAFPKAMKNLKSKRLDDVIIDSINNGIPFLGICLGMQLLFEESEEKGNSKGLGILKGNVLPLENSINNTVPHVGWNTLSIIKKNELTKNLDDNSRFYYDHSFYVKETDSKTFASLIYGQEICVGVKKKNIFGVQFHPEKSQRNGLKLLRNFANFIERN